MDCSLPGSSVHGILWARILVWVAMPFSRGIFPTQEGNPGLLHCRQILYHLRHQGSPRRTYILTIINLEEELEWGVLLVGERVNWLLSSESVVKSSMRERKRAGLKTKSTGHDNQLYTEGKKEEEI